MLVRHLAYGEEAILLGQVVAVSMDREALEAQDPYQYLRLFAFLQDNTYGVIEQGRKLKA